MMNEENRRRLRQRLLRRREKELSIRKELYTLGEAAKKLSISVSTLWKHIKDPKLQVEKFTSGSHEKRLISAGDMRKIWWVRNTVKLHAEDIYELSEQQTGEHPVVRKVS